MKKVSEKFKYFLIVLFSFWFLIFPAYLYFSTLDDLDIAPFYTRFENIDQEDSIPSSEKKENILALTFFIKHILIAHLSLARIPNLSYQLPTLNSKSLILRC
jgi:hypothetical protein